MTGRPNLVLIGFMGSGKTTVGRRCAQELGLRFADSDSLVERKAGRTIAEIFAEYGETDFRSREREAVGELAAQKDQVISTGGGVVLQEENVTALRATGLLIFLNASPEDIVERTSGRSHRPLLAGAGNPFDCVRELLGQRMEIYLAAADVVLDTAGLDRTEVVERVKCAYLRQADTALASR